VTRDHQTAITSGQSALSFFTALNHACQGEWGSRTNPLHRIAARLRFRMNMNSLGLGGKRCPGALGVIQHAYVILPQSLQEV